MKCPTCNSSVPKNKDVCPFCGALVSSALPTYVDSAGPTFRWEQQSSFAPEIEFEAPSFEGDATPAAQAEVAPKPIVPEPQKSSPARRSPVSSLIRLLAIAFFLLIPLFNFFFRDFHFSFQSAVPPVLREAVLCESVAEALPQNPKTIFSVSRDTQVVFYTRWTGARGERSFEVQWSGPDGSTYHSPAETMQFQDGDGRFSVWGLLPLEARLPPGRWRAELLLDGRIRASSGFLIRP